MLIAQLMLQPADVLLLDEPTNDLDIPTLEILEESLLEYRGALVLVTHDRYMLDRVSTVVLGLDGDGRRGTIRGLFAVGGMARESEAADGEAQHRESSRTAAAQLSDRGEWRHAVLLRLRVGDEEKTVVQRESRARNDRAAGGGSREGIAGKARCAARPGDHERWSAATRGVDRDRSSAEGD